MVEDKPKILVIADGNYPEEVDSVSYLDVISKRVPNIAEYDVVIMDFVKVDSTRAKAILETPQLKRKCIHNLLWAGHELIIITDGVHKNIKGYRTHDLNNIFINLPFNILPKREEGTSVIVMDSKYEEYHKVVADLQRIEKSKD